MCCNVKGVLHLGDGPFCLLVKCFISWVLNSKVVAVRAVPSVKQEFRQQHWHRNSSTKAHVLRSSIRCTAVSISIVRDGFVKGRSGHEYESGWISLVINGLRMARIVD